MTPGQLHLLLDVHRSVQTGKPRRQAAAAQDHPLGLIGLAGMRRG